MIPIQLLACPFPTDEDISRWFTSLLGSFELNSNATFLNGKVGIGVLVRDANSLKFHCLAVWLEEHPSWVDSTLSFDSY